METPFVVAVCRDGLHRFSKDPQEAIELVESLGVRGDAHAGTLVQHRSRARRDPNQPNLRQVHLLQAEWLREAQQAGHDVGPGSMGENVLTDGVDLLSLPEGARLRMGDAVVRITGLRNPCFQINDFSPGLLQLAVRRVDGVASDSEVELGPTGGVRSQDGVGIERRAGVMSVVERGGTVRAGDPIGVELPDVPHTPLMPV